MSFNRPYFVGSQTSGVDGGSEGGRLSTTRLPATLVLYSVPLLQAIKRVRGMRLLTPAWQEQKDAREKALAGAKRQGVSHLKIIK